MATMAPKSLEIFSTKISIRLTFTPLVSPFSLSLSLPDLWSRFNQHAVYAMQTIPSVLRMILNKNKPKHNRTLKLLANKRMREATGKQLVGAWSL